MLAFCFIHYNTKLRTKQNTNAQDTWYCKLKIDLYFMVEIFNLKINQFIKQKPIKTGDDYSDILHKYNYNTVNIVYIDDTRFL